MHALSPKIRFLDPTRLERCIHPALHALQMHVVLVRPVGIFVVNHERTSLCDAFFTPRKLMDILTLCMCFDETAVFFFVCKLSDPTPTRGPQTQPSSIDPRSV